jgi:CBS domain-containing protein
MICVRDVMNPAVHTIGSDASVAEAARAMARWKIGSLVVVERGKPIGIVTEGDVSKIVAKGLDPKSTLVGVQKKKLLTVEPGEPVEVAAKMMADAGVKKLPVMDGRRLVGIVTQTDIVNTSFSLVTSLKEMVQARYRPPDFEM